VLNIKTLLLASVIHTNLGDKTVILMMENMQPHRPYSIPELSDPETKEFDHEANVRVLGKVIDHNIVSCAVILTSALSGSADNKLLVDTTLVEPIEFQTKNSTVMVLGEAQKNAEGKVFVKAKIFTQYFGVDEPIYWKAVEKQREYFTSRTSSPVVHNDGK